MGLSSGALSKLGEAKATGGGSPIRDGRYSLLIEKVIGEKKFKGETVIFEFVVMRSEPVVDGVIPNAVGTRCSYVLNLDTNRSAAGNVKSLVLALFDMKEDTITAAQFIETFTEMTGPSQPARGMMISTETFRKKIQSGANAGNMFTGHNWKHVKNTPESTAAGRAMLDQAGETGATTPAAIQQIAPPAT